MGKAASSEVLLRFSAAAFDEGVVAAEDVGSQSEEDEGDREEGEGIEAWARIGSLKTRWAEDECRFLDRFSSKVRFGGSEWD